MRKTILFSIFLLFSLAGCNKNKYNSIPSLHYKSVSAKQIHPLDITQFVLSFTDKEGDLTDSIFVSKVSKSCNTPSGSQGYPLPAFPTTKNISGDILVNVKYSDFPPLCPDINDTAVFKFVLKDKAQHRSDTATSETVIIYQQ